LLLSNLGLPSVSYCFVKIKLANIRREASQKSELESQALRGWPLYIISTNTKGDWHEVITLNGFVGFVESWAVSLSNTEEFEMWLSAPKRVLAKTYGHFLQGSLAIIRNENQQFTELIFPERGILELENPELVPETASYNKVAMVTEAKKFLGVQYLWGGVSELGFDCSGFIWHLFLMHGFVLPRNSSQQAKVGTTVVLEALELGDLIFMGEEVGKIGHVTLFEGDGEYIHSSGEVIENAIVPEKSNFDPKRMALIQWAKRYHESDLVPLPIALDQFRTIVNEKI